MCDMISLQNLQHNITLTLCPLISIGNVKYLYRKGDHCFPLKKLFEKQDLSFFEK